MENNKQYITKHYNSATKMQKDKVKMLKQGWRVVDTMQEKGNYGCFKTLVFGLIFLPLALLGKSRDKWVVTYERD